VIVSSWYGRGSDAAFTQPRSFKVLLEISHFHLFAMGILVLTMTHLVLFAPIGVDAAIAYTVGHMGIGVLVNLAKVLVTLYVALVAFRQLRRDEFGSRSRHDLRTEALHRLVEDRLFAPDQPRL